MVLGIVKIALSALRAIAEAGFFLEAQRFLLRFVRPTSQKVLTRIENSLLSQTVTPVRRRWIKTSEHTLHVLVIGNEKNSRKIVVLHGHSMSATYYFRNFDDLISLGYCIYAIDLLGWGRSDRPKFEGKTPSDSLYFYINSLHECLTILNTSNFTLMGHSIGGYIAYEFAKAYPSFVNKLILISPAACSKFIPLSRAIYFSLPPQSIVRRGGLIGFLAFVVYYPTNIMYIADRLRDYTYHLALQSPPSGELAIRPLIRFHGFRRATCVRPLMDNIEKLNIPILLVCGETDGSMRVEDVHDFYRELKKIGSDVHLNVVKGADHCPHLEKPRLFLKAISQFCGFINN